MAKKRYRNDFLKRGDFMVDDKYLFEIGGKGKTFRQIADIQNSFVVNSKEVGCP